MRSSITKIFILPEKCQKTKGFFTFLGGIEVCRIPKSNQINENIDRKSAKKESEALSCMVIFFQEIVSKCINFYYPLK